MEKGGNVKKDENSKTVRKEKPKGKKREHKEKEESNTLRERVGRKWKI